MNLKEINEIYDKLDKCKELIEKLDSEHCEQREILQNLVDVVDATWKTVDDIRGTMDN